MLPLREITYICFGPFDPAMSRGNMVILVCTNIFTKYVVAIPLPDQQVELVANTLIDKVYLPLGIRAETHTD